ncbi:MAG TPA: periplasmic heavy metal sensor [Thermoanaerobaculia bacterium]
MKRWWVVIALLLSVGINIGLFAAILTARLKAPARTQAQAEDERQPQPPAVERLQKLADRLGLQGEPRRRFLAYQRRFFQETARERRHLGDVNRELRLELISDSPDRERIQQLTTESSELYRDLERALAGNVLESRKLLGPEQERTYLDLIRQLRPGRNPLAPPGAPPAAPWRRGLEQSPPGPQAPQAQPVP